MGVFWIFCDGEPDQFDHIRRVIDSYSLSLKDKIYIIICSDISDDRISDLQNIDIRAIIYNRYLDRISSRGERSRFIPSINGPKYIICQYMSSEICDLIKMQSNNYLLHTKMLLFRKCDYKTIDRVKSIYLNNSQLEITFV